MVSDLSEYQRKLTTAQEAVSRLVQTGDTLVHGLAFAEPPTLLAAVAQAVREGRLDRLIAYSMLPQKYAAESILAPDLAGC